MYKIYEWFNYIYTSCIDQAEVSESQNKFMKMLSDDPPEETDGSEVSISQNIIILSIIQSFSVKLIVTFSHQSSGTLYSSQTIELIMSM